MAPRIARKPVGLSSPRSHGIDVTGSQASFRKGSRDQRPTPCQASEWDDSEDREKACRIFGSLQSWHRRDWKSGILSQGIEGSAPHSLPSEGQGGSEDREKACRIFGSLQSWHRRDWRPARSAAAKKWLQRFRKRWNLCLGRLPAKDTLPTETMRAKARFGVAKK